MEKPLLILAFNRPQHIKRLIDSLRPHAPKKILVGVDGPRPNKKGDAAKVSQVLEEISKIDWTSDVELRVREKNLGLRFAVADAVTWAIKKYGEVIVVEDDIEVGPEFLTFMSDMLERFRNDPKVGHISGYNLVPEEVLSDPNNMFRFSAIPESYAWATWSRAWSFYDAEMSAVPKFKQLKLLLGSWTAAIVWKINFFDAKKENINTWAYRWIATLWAHNLICVSPNRNLINYVGHEDGTHTFLPSSRSELPIANLPKFIVPIGRKIGLYPDDLWIQKAIFKASVQGILFRVLASVALRFRKLFK